MGVQEYRERREARTESRGQTTFRKCSNRSSADSAADPASIREKVCVAAGTTACKTPGYVWRVRTRPWKFPQPRAKRALTAGVGKALRSTVCL